MTDKMMDLKEKAYQAKAKYLSGSMSRDEAKKQIQPYAEEYNKIGSEKARKYNQRFRPFSFSAYMRSSY